MNKTIRLVTASAAIALALATSASAEYVSAFGPKAAKAKALAAPAPRAVPAAVAAPVAREAGDVWHVAYKDEMGVTDNNNGTATITLKTGTSATVLTGAALDDYATTNYVNTQVSGLAQAVQTTLEDYVTETDLGTTLADYSTTTEMNTAIQDATNAVTSALEDYADTAASQATSDAKDYIDGATNDVMTVVNGKADAATTLAGYGITDATITDGTDSATITLGSTSVEVLKSVDLSAYATTATVNAYSNELAGAISDLDTAKADKATTLAGYGITDASTTAEMNTAIGTATNALAGEIATTLADYVTDTDLSTELADYTKTADLPVYTVSQGANIGVSSATSDGTTTYTVKLADDVVIPAAGSFCLTSPNGTKFSLAVDNDGQLYLTELASE